jgi:hypothetical protein
VVYTATVGAPVTGSPVVVTLANGQTITIESVKTTGTVTTSAPNDALTGHAPLTNAITNVSGGNYEPRGRQNTGQHHRDRHRRHHQPVAERDRHRG